MYSRKSKLHTEKEKAFVYTSQAGPGEPNF
jgi:hypothetical protein